METIINGLLTDFERGKMTRRQLIQSLALAAAAAAPVAAASAQGPSTIPAATGPAVYRRHQPRLLRHRELEYRGRQGRAREARSEAAARHGRRQLQELPVKDPDGWDLQISNVTKTTRE